VDESLLAAADLVAVESDRPRDLRLDARTAELVLELARIAVGCFGQPDDELAWPQRRLIRHPSVVRATELPKCALGK
jgi:hypothetical protein